MEGLVASGGFGGLLFLTVLLAGSPWTGDEWAPSPGLGAGWSALRCGLVVGIPDIQKETPLSCRLGDPIPLSLRVLHRPPQFSLSAGKLPWFLPGAWGERCRPPLPRQRLDQLEKQEQHGETRRVKIGRRRR